jgi:hypothetical protein
MKIYLLVMLLLLLVGQLIAHSDGDISDEEDEEEITEDQEYEFQITKKVIVTGVKAGELKWTATLVAPPYNFMRKRDAKRSGGTSLFSCNGCHALNYWIYAKAMKIIANNGSISYDLLNLPDNHECQPSTAHHLVRQFRKQLYATVEQNPTRSVNRIYESVRNDFARLLKEDQRLFFLVEIPTFRNIQKGLYKYRQKFIPKTPGTQVCI